MKKRKEKKFKTNEQNTKRFKKCAPHYMRKLLNNEYEMNNRIIHNIHS